MENNPFNILVADDDPEIIGVISTGLKNSGHNAEVARNGKEAMKLFTLKPAHYDILITDHCMPLVTGLELVHYLRKNEYQGRIIVMSGSLTHDLITTYQSKTVDKILQKPFELDDLFNTINNILKQWSMAVPARM